MDWTGYVNRNQCFARYRKPTSVTKKVTISELKVGKLFMKQMVPRKKLERTFLYWIKLTFNQNLSKKIRSDISYLSKEKSPKMNSQF